MVQTVSQQLNHLVKDKQATTERARILADIPPMPPRQLRCVVVMAKLLAKRDISIEEKVVFPVNLAKVLVRYIAHIDTTKHTQQDIPFDIENLRAIQWLEALGNEAPSEQHIKKMTVLLEQKKITLLKARPLNVHKVLDRQGK